MKTQPLSARLLAAAIVTGVDVVGGILLPDTAAGQSDARGRKILKARRQLPFVPGHRAPSPAEKFKADRRIFVDPRRTAPFEHAHFEFAGRPPIQAELPVVSARAAKEARPITAWKPVDDDAIANTGYRGDAPSRSRKAARASAQRLVTVPLKLVPPADLRSVEHRRQDDRPRGQPVHARSKARPPRGTTALPLEPCLQLSPARPRASAPVLCFKDASSFFVPNSSPLEPTSTGKPDFLDTVSALDDPSVSSSAEEVNDQSCLIGATADFHSQSSPAHNQLHDLAPSVPDLTVAGGTLPPDSLVVPVPGTSHTITLTRSAPRRPLKSLVSMLDNFREIARSATQKPTRESQPRSHPKAARSILPPLDRHTRPGSALPDDSFSLRRLRARVVGAPMFPGETN
ncbi:hypothetical protein L226DRAFT_612954 [Lentinus tigrinus ALCF2SS1-7]|nr:hypothetical protein L226DRAFT_612954 [Lentinus tigrinus ALCF2SS1-7]